MALPKNRKAVQALLSQLERLILGKKVAGSFCDDTIQHGDAVAVAIIPTGDTNPGQEIKWHLWLVKMETHKSGYLYSGLSLFVKPAVLDEMFDAYFAGQLPENPYRLDIDGAERVYLELPIAVCISENSEVLRFSFSFGREQKFAQKLDEACWNHHSYVPSRSNDFQTLLRLLEGIKPTVYRGGADPELPYESEWLLDYKVALEIAKKAKFVLIQCASYVDNQHGQALTNGCVVFVKAV